MRRTERELAAVVARVKDKEVDEVVEVDVEGEMEEAFVKEEEETKEVVEAAPAGGGGEPVAQGVDGVGGCTRQSWLAPTPQNLDTPLLVDPESPVWTLRFLLVRVHQRLLGAGRWVWVDGGGGLSTWTSPCAWGWSRGRGGGNVSCRGRRSDGGRWGAPPKGG